nr:unnamed protein product [Callosobruchus analis]
MSRNIIVVNN